MISKEIKTMNCPRCYGSGIYRGHHLLQEEDETCVVCNGSGRLEVDQTLTEVVEKIGLLSKRHDPKRPSQ
jgi:DnaJ-class molecular chaperone